MFGFHCESVILLFSITFAEDLHLFVVNISNDRYTYQCGRGFCDGFHNYCHYIDENILDGICRPCTKEMCRYESKIPDQCWLMCKAFGYMKECLLVGKPQVKKTQIPPDSSSSEIEFIIQNKNPICYSEKVLQCTDQSTHRTTQRLQTTPTTKGDRAHNWQIVSFIELLFIIALIAVFLMYIRGYLDIFVSKVKLCRERNSKPLTIIAKPSDDPTNVNLLNPTDDPTNLKV